MRISGVGPAGSQPRRTEKTGKGKGDDFARAVSRFSAAADTGAEAARSVDQAPSVAPLDSLLAAQLVDAVGDATEEKARRQAVVQRGEDILDHLEDLRVGLLLGHIPKDRLGRLVRLVREQRAEARDPQLAAMLDEIELRAEVELAKLARR